MRYLFFCHDLTWILLIIWLCRLTSCFGSSYALWVVKFFFASCLRDGLISFKGASSTFSRLTYVYHYILSSIKVRTISNMTMKLTAVDIMRQQETCKK